MVSAFVLIKAQPGLNRSDAAAVHDAAHKIPGVKTVHFLMGRIDGIVYVEANDLESLTDSISKIRSAKGVASTETCVVMPI